MPRNNYTIREGSLEATTEEDELLKLQRPDIRARGRTSGACAAAMELHEQTANSISGRTSGASPKPGHPAPPRKSSIDDLVMLV